MSGILGASGIAGLHWSFGLPLSFDPLLFFGRQWNFTPTPESSVSTRVLVGGDIFECDGACIRPLNARSPIECLTVVFQVPLYECDEAHGKV